MQVSSGLISGMGFEMLWLYLVGIYDPKTQSSGLILKRVDTRT